MKLKRMVACILTLLLVVSILPMTALAEETINDRDNVILDKNYDKNNGQDVTVPKNITVGINNGSVMFNEGTVESNNGSVMFNEGTVESNNKNVEINYSAVGANNGSVIFNDGTIGTNNGTVEESDGTIGTNNKNVEINYNKIRLFIRMCGKR